MAVETNKRSDGLLLCQAGRVVVRRSTSSLVLGSADNTIITKRSEPVILRAGNDLPEYIPPSPDPELTSWNLSASDQGVTYALLVVYDTTTINDPCQLRFMLDDIASKDTVVMDWSTPDQNNPHFSMKFIYTYTGLRGRDYIIHWQWKNAANPSASAWVSTGIGIRIPLIGEATENAGDI